MSTYSSFWKWSFGNTTFDDIISPLRDIPILFLQLFQSIINLFDTATTNKHANDGIDIVSGPLIAFSYAGMLWSYYLGCVAFLRDHFDLHKSKITLSGISAGCSSVMVIFLDLTIEQGFEFGLEWQKLFDSRFLKFFCLSTSETLHMIMNKFIKFGINDQVLKQKYEKYGGNTAINFGISSFQFSKCRVVHLLLNDFNNLQETIYAALCSMRVFPFFRSFGFFKGYYCCDGAITSNYSIPEVYRNNNKNKDKIIKIGVLSNKLVKSDICPSKNFYLSEFIIAGALNDNLIRFNKGYKDAAKFKNILKNYCQKGLIWNNSKINKSKLNDYKYKKNWDKHIDDKIKQWNEKITDHIEACQHNEE